MAMFGAMMSGWSGGMPETGKGVAIIRVEGVIVAGRGGAEFMGPSVAGSETITDHIQRALRDPDARALLVRINSPGGSAAGAEEIYHQLMKAREKKPVVISMGDVAASGGYYIAAAGDEIFSNAGTITGSIGVITSHLDLSALLKKVGADYESITSGEFKDMGSFSRPMTARERDLLKGLIGDVYEQFVEAVVKGRNMPKEKVLKIADGRIFTGRQAMEAGLVDKIGGFEEALDSAAQKAGIRGRPRRIEYGPRGLFDLLFGQSDYTMSLEALARQMLIRQGTTELSDTMLR
jgi:protease-4